MFLEPRDKVLKIKTRQRLIGCAGKVFLEPGDSVYEVDPEEDGMVNVRTSDGMEGSIPVTAIGRETLTEDYNLTTLYFRSNDKEEEPK